MYYLKVQQEFFIGGYMLKMWEQKWYCDFDRKQTVVTPRQVNKGKEEKKNDKISFVSRQDIL